MNSITLRAISLKYFMNDLSIYIHWPFCLSKCPYCDFNSHVSSNIDHELWFKSYINSLYSFKSIINGKYVKSCFFGGGTPSLMQPKIVSSIIDAISELAVVDNKTEITLEANPTSFEIQKFKDFKKAGVNRISIGVQSLINNDLKNLGRNHSANDAIVAVIEANNIFDNVSFDLIYARNDVNVAQSLKDWQKELKQAIDIATGHISLYQLTIEKGTKFYRLFRDNQLILPSSSIAADMYEWTNDYMQERGYIRYEISNYSLPDRQCRHNLTYWRYNDYLGIGPGAHSRIKYDSSVEKKMRSIMMFHNPAKWLQSVNASSKGIQNSHYLSKQEMITEFIMMSMRLNEGMNIKSLENLSSMKVSEIINMDTLGYYENMGLIQSSQNHNNICFTTKGLMLHNYLVPRLINNKLIVNSKSLSPRNIT